VSRDYALTRVGREPAREMIMARLAKEPLFASNNDAALNMFTCRYGHDISSSLLEPHGLLSHGTMQSFLKYFQEKYGGAEAYIRRYVGLTDDEIATIKRHILIPGVSHL
jgi:hypothetical protein